MTTALFNTLIDAVPDCFATVSRVLIGGEQLDAARIRRWYRDNPASATELVNVYGPTECTTFALYHPIPADFAGDVVPIGRPLPSTAAVLVADGNRAAAAASWRSCTCPARAWPTATATWRTKRRAVSCGCPGTTTGPALVPDRRPGPP
ncbi:AMP-binding enzyme family protein [Mycobacterium kansasii]|uniref:AMP-binding enzyme family protein n=1 Tax=Mycobacterium kansasii TaxID=1768 RepID=A0A1V3X687_MYCKA|nr:AMP-binding enzyme family protein [Mycobacterium kansasii]